GIGGGLRRITQSGGAEWSDSWILLAHQAEPSPEDISAGSFRLVMDTGSRQWGGRRWNVDLELGVFNTDTGEFDGEIKWSTSPWIAGVTRRDIQQERQLERLKRILTDEPDVHMKVDLRRLVGGSNRSFDELWADQVAGGFLREQVISPRRSYWS